MDKSYHELIQDGIYMGGAADVEAMIVNDGVQVIVDLRAESTGCAYTDASAHGVEWIQVPLADDAEEPEAELFGTAIEQVITNYQQGKKVAFHCGGGRGRTGTVAVGTLYKLGLAKTLDEANEQARSIRPILNMKPDQRHSLELWLGL